MRTIHAAFTPGDDKSPLAPSIEMLECAVARLPPPSKEALASAVSFITSSYVTCSSLEYATRMQDDSPDPRQLCQVLDHICRQLAASLGALGLSPADVADAAVRMAGDAIRSAGGKS